MRSVQGKKKKRSGAAKKKGTYPNLKIPYWWKKKSYHLSLQWGLGVTSKIPGHGSITIKDVTIMTKFEILCELPKYDTET